MIVQRSLMVLGALLLAAPAVQADEVGGIGPIVALQLNTPSGDAYLQYHGRMFVKSATGVDEYRWGGTSCGSRVLTDTQFAAVQRAFDNKQLRIRPIYQDGQASTLCVVGFTMIPAKYKKLGL